MLRIGTDSEFQIARDFLREKYPEKALETELGVSSVFDFQERPQGYPVQNSLVKLFFGGAYVPKSELAPLIPEKPLQALMSLGLIEAHGDRYLSPVLLYPMCGLTIASDRLMTPEGIQDPKAIPEDFVYFALTARTKTFLEMQPERECDALLDVGSGSGAAAIVGSRFAKECWASDISPRSTLFADFNARLNGKPNVHAVEGSLYEPVAGKTFDRIVCHPPYDTTLRKSCSFCDGGYDGEFVVRGVVEGLPTHLRPGGQLYVQTRGGDRKGKPLEHRIREWLGEAHKEFDIVVVVRDIVQPEEFAFSSVMSITRDMADYEAYMARFKEIELERFVYSAIFVERKTDASPPLTLRKEMGKQVTSAELEWLLSCQRGLSALTILDGTPSVADGVELQVRHAFQGGELTPIDYVVEVTAPFRETVSCPEWVARLLAGCDGKHTGREIYDAIQKHAPLQLHEFEAALRRLVQVGAVNPGARGACA
jgi:SAM-dependent methyltransferase